MNNLKLYSVYAVHHVVISASDATHLLETPQINFLTCHVEPKGSLLDNSEN